MKKSVGVLCIIMMLMTASVSAIELDDTNAYWMTGVHTDNINNDAIDQANMLKQLGLFIGTGKGFELDRNMTRAEAAVMLVRFLGAEKKVLAGTWKHPFIDVPAWADKYVGWLYQSGLTKGISKTKYGGNQKTNLEQYAIFLSRAVSGNDDWKANGVATADEVKLWDKENGFFFRAAAVGLSTRTLTLTYTRNGNYTYTMAQFLINHGIFTSNHFLDLAWGVLPVTYKYLDSEDHIYNTIAGVTVGKTDIGGFYNMTGIDSTLPYFYASAIKGQGVALYRIDCKTMKSTMISSEALFGGINDWICTYTSTVKGIDYLFEYSKTLNTLSLFQCSGSTLQTVLPNFRLFESSTYPEINRNYFVTDDALLIACDSQYVIINKDGSVAHAFKENTQILGFYGNYVITQLATKENTIISCLNVKDGTIVDKYTVNQDMQEDYFRRTVDAKGYGTYYGEAGLYVFDNNTGRLKQVTSRPTLDLTAFRNDNRYIILTHNLGERVHGVIHNGGNQIVIIDSSGIESVLLSNTPKHGISIGGFIYGNSGDTISFYSEEDVGMMHLNIYNYILLPSYDATTGKYDKKQPTVIVTGYTAGCPETEKQGYEQRYIQKEQTRLNSLGYGYK